MADVKPLICKECPMGYDCLPECQHCEYIRAQKWTCVHEGPLTTPAEAAPALTEPDDPHPGYDCGGTCAVHKDGLWEIRRAAIHRVTSPSEAMSDNAIQRRLRETHTEHQSGLINVYRQGYKDAAALHTPPQMTRELVGLVDSIEQAIRNLSAPDPPTVSPVGRQIVANHGLQFVAQLRRLLTGGER